MLWNLAFVFVTIAVLWFSSEENPDVPLRLWIIGYNLQCLFHVGCVIAEYRRRGGDDNNPSGDSDSNQGSSLEEESDDYGLVVDPEIEPGTRLVISLSLSSHQALSSVDDDSVLHCSLAKHLESTNAIFSFVWWIIGFYWVTADSEELAQSSPQLYWFVLNRLLCLCI